MPLLKSLLCALLLVSAISATTSGRESSATVNFVTQISEHSVITDNATLLNHWIETELSQSSWEPQIASIVDQVVGSSSNNTCINGKDPSTLTPQQQLLEFVQGPCSPFVIVPGLLASRLTVSIDCQALQSGAPDVFSSCGWDSCTSGIGHNVPNSEYVLWIADFTSPLSPLINSSSECWGNLVQMTYNPSAPTVYQEFTSPPGVLVSAYGADNATHDATCGFSGVDNLLPIPDSLQPQMTRAWDPYVAALTSLGYQIGLTLYAIPYDWRRTTVGNGVGSLINNTIQQAYNLTGKPSVIISHSLGNFGALYFLNNMPLEQKEAMIAQWISFENPLAGAGQATVIGIGGQSSFVYDDFGIGFPAQKHLINSAECITDVLPKDTYERFASDEWLQEWAQRQNLENTYNVSTPEGKAEWESLVQSGNYPLPWFPTPLANCSVGFEQRPDNCFMGMYNWSAEPSVVINDGDQTTVYTASVQDSHTVFTTYDALVDDYSDKMKDSMTNNVYLLTNPQVPVSIVYGAFLNTVRGGLWDYDPNSHLDNGEFAFPTTTLWTAGDGTVPTAASLLPAIKWIWEYENAAVDGAKPIKVVEFCSIYNQKGTPYDVLNPSAPYEITSVGYVGLNCDCLTGSDNHPVSGSNCEHSDAPGDEKMMEFVINVLFTNYKNANYQNTGAYLLTNAQIVTISQNCPGVNPGSTMYWDLFTDIETIQI